MVWILLGIGLLLIIFNIKAINKEKNSFQKVFNYTQEDMQEFDFKLSELRREFSETILELQKEIVELKESYELHNNKLDEIKNINKENLNGIKENRINDDKVYNSENLNSVNENQSFYLNEEENSNKTINNDEEVISDSLYEENQNNEVSNNIKVDEINKLLALGLSIEEISEKLGIGRGEVLLIKELYLR